MSVESVLAGGKPSGHPNIILDLSIPMKPPSLNDWKGARSWKKYHYGIALPWKKAIRLFAGFASRQTRGARVVEVTRLLGPRERPYDGDNAKGGTKPITDALVLLGWLRGDTPADVLVVMGPEVLAREPGTRIVLRTPWHKEMDTGRESAPVRRRIRASLANGGPRAR